MDFVSRVLNALNSLVYNWYTVATVAEFAQLDIEATSDALCELELAKKVEIDEWEDGIRVRLREEVIPLTAEQQAVVEQHIPLAYKMAMEKYERKWLANEELAQHLCLCLVEIVKRWKPEESPNFMTYAVPCLKGERTTWFMERSHLRGYKLGKEYEHVPEVVGVDIDNPDSRGEYENSFAYDPCSEVDRTDEIAWMLRHLEPLEAQAIFLTEYHDYTGDEAAEAAKTTRSILGKAKKKGLEKLREGFSDDRSLISRKPIWDLTGLPNHLVPVPSVMVGITEPWLLAKFAKSDCPVCSRRSLEMNEYCIRCDRWGMDAKAKAKPRMSFMKSTTLKMTKARDKYRRKDREKDAA